LDIKLSHFTTCGKKCQYLANFLYKLLDRVTLDIGIATAKAVKVL